MTKIRATVYGPPNLYAAIVTAKWNKDEKSNYLYLAETSIVGNRLHLSAINEFTTAITFFDSYSGTGVWKRGTLSRGAIEAVANLITNKLDEKIAGNELIIAGMKISRHKFDGAEAYHMLFEAEDNESTSIDTP